MAERVEESMVTIVYSDGTTREFRINAGPGVATYLAGRAGGTGMLHLRNETESLTIPVAHAGVVEWRVTGITKETSNGNG
jgi:hypothetical protein